MPIFSRAGETKTEIASTQVKSSLFFILKIQIADTQFEVKLPKDRRDEISIDLEKVLHLADVATSMTFVSCFNSIQRELRIKDVINFVKEVPDFKQLNEQDQVIIIRNAAIEVV